MSIIFHAGNRQLQDRFDSRRISDRLEEKLARTTFNSDDKAFIEGAAYFFLATASPRGLSAPRHAHFLAPANGRKWHMAVDFGSAATPSAF